MRTADSMGELYDLVSAIPCPACTATNLKIEIRRETTAQAQITSFGCRERVVVQMWPWIICEACGFEEKGIAT